MKSILRALTACLAFVTALDAADAPKLSVSVHFDGRAHVSDNVISGARKHVERIFRYAGIDIQWNAVSGLDLTIVLTETSALGATQAKTATVMGMALSNSGKGCRRAYVFVDRVESQAAGALRAEQAHIPDDKVAFLTPASLQSLMLGHAIAHEMGHLMLPRGHSDNGLMSARIDRSRLRSAIDGKLLFSADQGEYMRSVAAASTIQQ
jgi:hypothetical protein